MVCELIGIFLSQQAQNNEMHCIQVNKFGGQEGRAGGQHKVRARARVRVRVRQCDVVRRAFGRRRDGVRHVY